MANVQWAVAYLTLWTVIIVAIWRGWQVHHRKKYGLGPPDVGWIYFITPIKADEDDDPPTPIKIGRTNRDPEKDRLPEIETMSPFPLKLIWSFKTYRPELAERQIHKHLRPFRMHGEWFEREPTLAFIDHLKESL